MDHESMLDLRAFVPAKDAAISRQFYSDLGFRENWADEQIAEFQIGEFRFLLQSYYLKEYAENCVMHLTVRSVDTWWRHVQDTKLVDKYAGVTVKQPAMQPWGLLAMFLTDPAGVLWHIAEPPRE